MMNARVLELLKNPKNIQSEDLHLLKEEINSFPYIQNIRALHLYGVHLYDKENYQKELSTTAAYTTDKKILYHLINGKNPPIKVEKPVEKPFVIQKRYEGFPLPKAEKPIAETEEFSQKHDYEAVSESLITPKPEIKPVFVNGERNRILFDGEENFLDEANNETIDLESTLESGVIVTQKAIPADENQNQSENIPAETETEFVAAPSDTIINEDKIDSEKVEEKINDESELSFVKIESFKPETDVLEENIEEENTTEPLKSEEVAEVLNTETIIEEDKIDSENIAEKVNDEAELSFHGTDSFLPEIKIESNQSEKEVISEIPKSNINKHEDEMRRLIEEVEKKMKAQKKEVEEKPKVQEEEISSEISFAETQAFHVGEEQKAAEEVVVKIAESIVEETLEEEVAEVTEETAIVEAEEEVVSTWKPMSFESHTPDSFSRKIEIQSEPIEKIEKVEENIEAIPEETNSEIITENSSQEPINDVENVEETVEAEPASSVKDDEVPVMNVSFFGNDISSLSIKKEEEKKKQEPIERVQKPILSSESKILDDSNVPGFINTWQSWLKIDRTEEVEKVKTEIKNKAIESFIENNPKISQLKDEVNFVVKEKTDDISHLMTETLANLYIEQKLYTKAINAFQILVNKHPDRKEYFENKIQEIKDNRGKN